MGSKRLAATVVLLFASGAVGCVSSGSYNTLEGERDQLRANNAELQTKVASLKRRNDEMSEQLVSSETQLSEMGDTHDRLVANLRGEVAAGQIQIRQVVSGVELNIPNEILYPTGSAALTASGSKLIQRVAEEVRTGRSIVTVEGHTDSWMLKPHLREEFATNWELAAARAARVVRRLTENGVDPTRLRAVSRGPFAPIASNDTAEGRAKNRRIEIIVRPIP